MHVHGGEIGRENPTRFVLPSAFVSSRKKNNNHTNTSGNERCKTTGWTKKKPLLNRAMALRIERKTLPPAGPSRCHETIRYIVLWCGVHVSFLLFNSLRVSPQRTPTRFSPTKLYKTKTSICLMSRYFVFFLLLFIYFLCLFYRQH